MNDARGKQALRRTLRSARRSASARVITPPTALLARFAPGVIVASYLPIGSEADPAPLAAAALAADCTLALPHVADRETALRFMSWQDTQLIDGPFGLRQPADGVEVAPDIILTPLLGFDRAGHRLGQGAGHYDRAFACHPHAWRIGVALSVQEVEVLPVDPWDVPLHAVVTEQEWIVTA